MLAKIDKKILIFSFAFLSRFLMLWYPKKHIFDEVYHVFTAQALARWDPRAWEWWNQSPTGFAYEWTHPPLAKEFMAASILFFGDNSFSWRFFSALFGGVSIIVIYFIALSVFKDRKIALLSSLVASLSGLMLVMSRIGMNDSYFLFFSLLGILMFLKNKKLLMGMFLGLSLASKWTALFTIILIGILYLFKLEKIRQRLIFLFSLLVVPLLIYLVSYFPFFLQKHTPPGQNLSNPQTFIELQRQMYWYHTNLKATHTYQSTPPQWIFDLRPVWLYVDYGKNSIANIYTLDNPILVWTGLISIIFLLRELLKKFTFGYFTIVLFWFGFFAFWVRSPRIMFNYHYLPSTAFLTIAIGVTLNELLKIEKGKFLLISYLLSLIALFIYFYPLWVGIHVPTDFYNSYFWFQSWK